MLPQNTVRSIRLSAAPGRGLPANTGNLAAIIQRRLNERCGPSVSIDPAGEWTLELDVQPGIGEEGFRIEDVRSGHLRITGNDARGLLYGVGKFLRSSRYLSEGFVPGAWRGTSRPARTVRGIYFATHFHNFYHDAPLAEIKKYLEDLALWGYNALNVWFDMHHYRGLDDAEARKMIQRLTSLLRTAKEIGLAAGFGVLANESFADSPAELRADQTFPGTKHYRGGYGLELCPGHPEGRKQILKNIRDEFGAFSDVDIDFLWIWPYDQGGCSCEKCRPWGANGFLTMAREEALEARKIWPKVKVYLSTWLYDCLGDEGEWRGLHRLLDSRPDWINYIIADSHTDFPRYPLEHDLPASYPIVNFPEISMWQMSPWGTYGANPLPMRFERLWNQAKQKLQGGFPYSEGIFEDINKAVVSQFYWGDIPAAETVAEYIESEFSPDAVPEVREAIRKMEQVHIQAWNAEPEAQDALFHMRRAEPRLSEHARKSWRWRILYLRAILDHELLANGKKPTESCRPCFEELTRLYYAQHADECVHPIQMPAVQ